MNFEKLFEQVKAVKIDNFATLYVVVSLIYDGALMNPTACEMYAKLCYHLAKELPGFTENNERITFKRLLLKKFLEEFDREEEEEANKADEEGETKQSAEESEEKRAIARRRKLGNIRLIGELYKKKMLTERVVHECIKSLLGDYQNPDEEDVEALCKLMSTIGEMIDRPKAKEHMDAYFEIMFKLSNNMKLSSRVRYMLKDAINLRWNKWQKEKIDEVHRDAAQERHHQSSRLPRNPQSQPQPQPQPIPSYAPTHNPNNLFFQPSSSLPLTSGQTAPNSQSPRFNYSVSQGPSEQQFASVSTPVHSEATSKHEGDIMDNSGGSMGSIASSKDKAAELTRTKSTTGKLKKKRREIHQKADAAGTASDLYTAYKGPEEKKESASSSEVIESNSAISKEAVDAYLVDSGASEKGVQNKFEPDDWEDAAGISTPKPETSDNREQILGGTVEHGKDENTDAAKKYSRDFLLKFSEQCTDLPESFEITSHIADALMTVNISQFVERESFPSPGRVMGSTTKDKAAELTRTKSTTGKLKKKRREIHQKADAAGTTSDLYTAYKGPEEKKESASSSEVIESNYAISKEAVDAYLVGSGASEKGVQNKFEPDDWEDAADISTPKPETSDNREQILGGTVEHGKDENTDTAKKYSRDFLLKFSEQCIPGSFEITSHIADALMTVNISQSNAGEAYPVPKVKKDIQVSAALPVSQTQKSSVLPMPMTSMQMPFHQSPVSVQFGGPKSQIQPQSVPPTSLQVPMPMTALPMGSAPQVQQPMFVPGLQPHPMQPQGVMHQGQSLAFAPQMGPQMPPQLGNLGIGISSQYPQQQGGKFGSQRKTTVKIIDPKNSLGHTCGSSDTYADSGSSGLRSHPNMPPQSQPIPSYAPTHPINYYPNSFNPYNLFFPPSSSLPLTSGQTAPNSQPPRFNYSVSQGPSEQQFAPVSTPVHSEATSKHEGDIVDNSGGSMGPIASSKDKAAELTRTKSTTGKLKKKKRKIYQKADVAGTASVLYTAYKGPDD